MSSNAPLNSAARITLPQIPTRPAQISMSNLTTTTPSNSQKTRTTTNAKSAGPRSRRSQPTGRNLAASPGASTNHRPTTMPMGLGTIWNDSRSTGGHPRIILQRPLGVAGSRSAPERVHAPRHLLFDIVKPFSFLVQVLDFLSASRTHPMPKASFGGYSPLADYGETR